MIKSGKHLWAQHPHVANDLTLGERAADALKHWFGTWTALFGVGVWIAVWITLQYLGVGWDIYPFVLLNLCLSCMAAVQGIILQISANRGDKTSAEVALHTQANTDELMTLNKQQLEILTELRALRAEVEAKGQ